ncbi:hypothetical protein M1N54_04130 [Thermodesulfovibrionales bacterium]|nr:hypothetical protein [Thermodesulfovibrionales bacterium]
MSNVKMSQCHQCHQCLNVINVIKMSVCLSSVMSGGRFLSVRGTVLLTTSASHVRVPAEVIRNAKVCQSVIGNTDLSVRGTVLLTTSASHVRVPAEVIRNAKVCQSVIGNTDLPHHVAGKQPARRVYR